MKQLIFKELREHLKVALLGFGVLTIMLVLAFNASVAQVERAAHGSMQGDALQPLLADDLLVHISFFCAIFAALLGWLQIHAERHPDLWAFLVHRPISRTKILQAKWIAGLVLYTLGAGLPLLVFVVVVAIPGNVATPFEWPMALPALAVWLTGIVYHLAGLLTGMRKARWYGSRGFGLGLAIITTAGVFAVSEFWQAFLIFISTTALLSLAVWSSYQSGGFYRHQPAAGKIALTITCVASVVILVFVSAGMLANMLSSRRDYTFSHYQLAKDGTVYKVTQHGTDAPDIVDLTGKPLLDEKTGSKIKLQDFQQRVSHGLSAVADFNGSPTRNRYRQRYTDSGRFFSVWRIFEKTIWYLSRDGRLLGYHAVTRRLAETLEPKTPSAQKALMLSSETSQHHLNVYTQPEILSSRDTAYIVDLEKREMKPLFTITNGDAIGGFSQRPSAFLPPSSNLVLLLTSNSVRLLDFSGRIRFTIPYEPSHLTHAQLSAFVLEPPNTFALRFDPDFMKNKESGGKLSTRITWLNSDGTIRNAVDLPKLPEVQRDNFSERLLSILVPPAVPIFFWEASHRLYNYLRFVPAVICVLIGCWLTRRNNFSMRASIGWAIFNFFFGLPGLLAFLAVQEWPHKEPCPQCEKPRVVTREQCEHCGANFPPPGKTGTEIFEPLTTA